MSSVRASERAQVTAVNLGGIDETSVSFSPGVTVLSGRNATNRTSFLRSLMAALGSEDVGVKGDAEEGRVELSIGDDRYERIVAIGDGTVHFDGTPYLDDAESADLFAFLLDSNDTRQTVRRGGDLYETLMRPIDTDEVEAEIRRLKDRKTELESELERLEDLEQRLPDLEEERDRHIDRIEEKQATLETKRNELDAIEREVDEIKSEQSELEAKLDDISETRSSLEEIRDQIRYERKSLEALQEERTELEEALQTTSEVPTDELERVESELKRLRDERRTVDSMVNKIQSAVQFNEDLLDDDDSELGRALEQHHSGDVGNASNGSVTDKLVSEGEDLVCWTCGRETDTNQIESTVELLRTVRNEKAEERRQLRERIDDLDVERERIESTLERYDQNQRKLQNVTSEIEERREQIDSLEEEQDRLEEKVERLETETEQLQSEDRSELLDLHREVNELEFELGRLQSDLEEVKREIDDVEDQLENYDHLSARLHEVEEELEHQRTLVAQVERSAVEEFNEQMDVILELLEYDNIERIWIERTEDDVREGQRKVTKASFDLHVVREADSGAVYEDTVDHLSESEREVVGLVVALAGYLVHDVYEEIPFMLLDSLEALDSQRVAKLVDYLEDYVEFLVVALLPEDAAALDGNYQRITEI